MISIDDKTAEGALEYAERQLYRDLLREAIDWVISGTEAMADMGELDECDAENADDFVCRVREALGEDIGSEVTTRVGEEE